MSRVSWVTLVRDCRRSDGGARSQAPPPSATAAEAHARGVEFHNARRLDEASREYARALSLDPPRPPSAGELAIIRRFAPRVYTTATEFFPLRDFAAVLHPSERLIAYHLFWEDDIDFPEDNDPCDHEVVWVQFSRDGLTLERFWTYFHGRILDGGEPAAARRTRPRHASARERAVGQARLPASRMGVAADRGRRRRHRTEIPVASESRSLSSITTARRGRSFRPRAGG